MFPYLSLVIINVLP